MPRYSPDFKSKALSMVREVGISKASSELHITRATLCRWRMQETGNCLQQQGTVCLGYSNSESSCLLKKYLDQSAQLNEALLILEGRIDQLQSKAKHLSEMNRKLVSLLGAQHTNDE